MVRLLMVISTVLVVTQSLAADINDPNRWSYSMGTGLCEVWIGARLGQPQGYDGEAPLDPTVFPGAKLFFHREESPAWSGPTGFYASDTEPPIPASGSRTWPDLLLWTDDAAALPDPNRARVWMYPDGPLPPTDYWAKLVLDYVPTALNWTGPTEYVFTLSEATSFLLPAWETGDGTEGTRMHLTVYSYPVPEPSSLSILSLALASAGAWRLRRRR